MTLGIKEEELDEHKDKNSNKINNRKKNKQACAKNSTCIISFHLYDNPVS